MTVPTPANSLSTSPKQIAIHLALSALTALTVKQPGIPPTTEALTAEAQAFLPLGVELPDEFADAVGEMYALTPPFMSPLLPTDEFLPDPAHPPQIYLIPRHSWEV